MPEPKPNIRSRVVDPPGFNGTGKLTFGVNQLSGSTSDGPFYDEYKLTRNGIQITGSVGHPWNSRKRIHGDVGGNFATSKTEILFKASPKVNLRSTVVPFPDYVRWASYSGFMVAVDVNNAAAYPFPPSAQTSDDDLDEYGATAVARCKPTNSVADLSVAIGEIFKDGLPHLVGSAIWKDKTRAAKSSGSEFLNVQFGWLPLVADIKNLSKAVVNADTVLAQYERDAGRVVRRRYNFPREKFTTEEVLRENTIPWYSPNHGDITGKLFGRLVRVRETTRVRWFSGAFTYHLPSGYDSRSFMARKALESKKLLGLSLTPETLWNLAPWSWAVDWFSNTGDVISNLSDWKTDGLVMRYGYIMETSVVKDTYTFEQHAGLEPRVFVPSITLSTTTKVRRRASPFGFGFNWDGLSPRQWAIAAALGLSRS